MKTLRVFYNERQVASSDGRFSPSAGKPEQVVRSWRRLGLPIRVVSKFAPATMADFALAHDQQFIRDIFAGRRSNGFGDTRQDVIDSLPWTTGSMIAATLDALKHGGITASPTSGFHHAGFASNGAFCTVNGLAMAAIKAAFAGAKWVGILDFDQHFGNGTEDIIRKLDLKFVRHWTLGASNVVADKERPVRGQKGWQPRGGWRVGPKQVKAARFLKDLPKLMRREFGDCDVLIYQAGADSCVDDPLGGRFTRAQMRARDRIVFRTARKMGLPVAWNLAGGYQDPLRKVLDLHDATMQEAVRARTV